MISKIMSKEKDIDYVCLDIGSMYCKVSALGKEEKDTTFEMPYNPNYLLAGNDYDFCQYAQENVRNTFF